MDHSRHRRYDAIHIWKDIGRQEGLYINRISGIGSSDCLGGFETITSDCGGECVKIEHVAMYVEDLEKARDFLLSILMVNPMIYIIIRKRISAHISLLLRMAQDWKL